MHMKAHYANRYVSSTFQGVFQGGFGVNFEDMVRATFHPGFGEFEMFYANFRFKFDATYRVPMASMLANGVGKAASTLDRAAQSLLGVVKDKVSCCKP